MLRPRRGCRGKARVHVPSPEYFVKPKAEDAEERAMVRRVLLFVVFLQFSPALAQEAPRGVLPDDFPLVDLRAGASLILRSPIVIEAGRSTFETPSSGWFGTGNSCRFTDGVVESRSYRREALFLRIPATELVLTGERRQSRRVIHPGEYRWVGKQSSPRGLLDPERSTPDENFDPEGGDRVFGDGWVALVFEGAQGRFTLICDLSTTTTEMRRVLDWDPYFRAPVEEAIRGYGPRSSLRLEVPPSSDSPEESRTGEGDAARAGAA